MTPTSICQNEALIVPKKNKNIFIVRAFPHKIREILVHYEKQNVRIQFRFDDDLFNITTKEKKTKKEKINIKRNYSKETQSKMVDAGFQFRFNDDLVCAIKKFEKSRNKIINAKKRQHLQIQPAVAKKIGRITKLMEEKKHRWGQSSPRPIGNKTKRS
jgi:hypothetical protein